MALSKFLWLWSTQRWFLNTSSSVFSGLVGKRHRCNRKTVYRLIIIIDEVLSASYYWWSNYITDCDRISDAILLIHDNAKKSTWIKSQNISSRITGFIVLHGRDFLRNYLYTGDYINWWAIPTLLQNHFRRKLCNLLLDLYSNYI